VSSLAEKIDLLFKTFKHPDGGEYTYQEVEEGTGKAITGAYVWKLRSGRAKNPSYKVLKVLTDFFKVPVSFLFEEEVSQEYLHYLKLAAQLREAGV